LSGRNGFLLVDKPVGLTSFDVIRKARKIFSCKKVGHAGTLDPEAEGVLVLAFGSATRLIAMLPAEPKIYRFSIQFGTQTDSLDRAGAIVRTGGTIPDPKTLATVLETFGGVQMQTPPGYSALKINGVRAYALARKGVEPVLTPRQITIHRLILEEYDAVAGKAACIVTCSGGTYVRALARDIAARLDTCGYAASIQRVASGSMALADACSLDSIVSSTPLLSARSVFKGFPVCEADETLLRSVATGRNVRLPVYNTSPQPGHVLLFTGDDVAAVLELSDSGEYHPVTVFVTPVGGEVVINADS
jgi:tRNA pseudouridine55 synthase